MAPNQLEAILTSALLLQILESPDNLKLQKSQNYNRLYASAKFYDIAVILTSSRAPVSISERNCT